MSGEIQIQSDDSAIKAILMQLAADVIDLGGDISPQMRVDQVDGELRVSSDAAEGTKLISLPPSCLIPIDEVEIASADGQRLEIVSLPASFDDNHRRLLDAMIALYNETGKLTAQRASLPWLVLADHPVLLDALHKMRADALKLSGYFEMAKAGQLNRLLVDSFLGSRTLAFPSADGPRQRVLMPFIDLLGHHSGARGFKVSQAGIRVDVSHPTSGSLGCFVNYNRLDALDAVLNYGFADLSAPFVRSVAMQIDIAEIGRIRVRSKVGRTYKGQLPDSLRGKRGYVPRIRRADDFEVLVSQLLFPREPEIFFQVVGFIVYALRPDLPHETLDRATREFAITAVEHNRQRLRRLLVTLRDHPAVGAEAALQQIRAAAEHSHKILKGYRLPDSRVTDQRRKGVPWRYTLGRGFGWS